MLQTFLATLNPVLTLFICIVIGFTLRATGILPESAGKVMSKLVTWVFAPALSFITLAKNCTVDTLSTHGANVLLSAAVLLLAVTCSILLTRLFVRQRSPERGVYQYALAFANCGYIGDPMIQSVFGDVMLSYYKLYTLPLNLVIYTWGITVLVPDGAEKKPAWKKLLNAPTVATLLGIVAGLTGLGRILPTFLSSTLTSLSACMGPTAMMVAGFTVAGYSITEMLKNKKVYVATALRLTLLPALWVSLTFGLILLAEQLWAIQINRAVLFLCFVAYAAPLGLNTVVFPEAYGGDPRTGASMALVSHTLFVITMPLLFALMFALFGTPTI